MKKALKAEMVKKLAEEKLNKALNVPRMTVMEREVTTHYSYTRFVPYRYLCIKNIKCTCTHKSYAVTVYILL